MTQTIDPKRETRSSAETSFLTAAVKSQQMNLKVYTHTMAKRILFSGNSAQGVLVNTAGVEYTLRAKKEVILSAGAFLSPQMLMVSGIGPKETLQKYNIPLISEREGVGKNMWDHVFFGPSYQIDLDSWGLYTDPATRQATINRYLVNRTGVLTTSGEGDYLAWEKLPNTSRAALSPSALEELAQFPPDWPEIEYQVLDEPLDGTTWQPGINYGAIGATLVSPLSRGTIDIVSNDTADLPLVNPNWLSSETDQQVAVESFKRCRTFLNATALQPVLVGSESPGARVETDAEILDYIKQTFSMVWHASCTCRFAVCFIVAIGSTDQMELGKMGMRNDSSAVVDSQARVIGVQNLRVVDASAFPLLPPGHPQSTVCEYIFAKHPGALG